MSKKNNIILIGFMGAGKTSTGQKIAAALCRTFLDTDEEIVREQHRPINEIFAVDGETYFRDLETGLLKRLLEEGDGLVISVGGGLPVRKENRELLHELGTVIFLQAREETLVARLQGSNDRPLLAGHDLTERVRTLMRDRMDVYLDAADICLETDDLNLEEAARACIRAAAKSS